jgi:type VI secretion system secreted protein VgrG
MSARLWKLALAIEGLSTDEVLIHDLVATETVSSGFTARVGAFCRRLVDPNALIGTTAKVTLQFAGDAKRHFEGIVLEASARRALRDRMHLHLTFGSRLELLRLGSNSRIFRDMSVPDVVKAVLTGAGLAEAEWQLSGDHRPHENIVQYGESDFVFIARLLAEEGIGFAVRHDDAKSKVVFFDESPSLSPVSEPALLYRELAGMAATEAIWDCSERRVSAPDAVWLRDYDLDKPAFDLSARDKTDASTGREMYSHPGGFTDPAEGKRLARLRLEGLRAGTRQLSARSNCPRLEAGRTFTLGEHPRAKLNGEHLVLSVTHTASIQFDTQSGHTTDTGYANEFLAMPRAVPYRPQLVEAPELGGVHVAFVTGPAAEEIHADKDGRVKVRFPWDRSGKTDDSSSTWLRVGQLALGGSMVLPRKDFEVIVDYELGDIDRPLVTGHLYNGLARPPYELPAHAARSSIQSATTGKGPGANELRFDDSAGGEEMMLNASKDLTIGVDNNASWLAGAKESLTVGANHALSVGTDHFANVKTSRALSVGGPQNVNVGGDYSDGVGGSESVSVGGSRHVKSGDHFEGCTAALTRTVGGLQSVTGIAGYQRKIAGASTTKVGGVWAEIAGQSRSSMCGGGRTETIGALKLIKAKQVSVSCGTAYTAEVGAYSVQCGGGRTDSAKAAVSIAAGGGMSVKASNIAIEAKSSLRLTAGACVIKLSSSGEVSIKAPSIDLTGVKALNQVMHKSN